MLERNLNFSIDAKTWKKAKIPQWLQDAHSQGSISVSVVEALLMTLPRFDVHQDVGNFLMNGERDGQEIVGAEPAVHG